jgi:hypothetical protein
LNGQTYQGLEQRGSVLILVTIGMVVLLGIAGLALDMGHAYLMKTRLQTALDAAALSGAKTLDITKGDTVQAELDALNTFTINAGDDMNDTSLTPVVDFSDVLFDPAQALDPRYVRVTSPTTSCRCGLPRCCPGWQRQAGGASAVSPQPTLGGVCDVFGDGLRRSVVTRIAAMVPVSATTTIRSRPARSCSSPVPAARPRWARVTTS